MTRTGRKPSLWQNWKREPKVRPMSVHRPTSQEIDVPFCSMRSWLLMMSRGKVSKSTVFRASTTTEILLASERRPGLTLLLTVLCWLALLNTHATGLAPNDLLLLTVQACGHRQNLIRYACIAGHLSLSQSRLTVHVADWHLVGSLVAARYIFATPNRLRCTD